MLLIGQITYWICYYLIKGDTMATSWRLAKSLETLRNQVNNAYPNRSKRSDGTIGDAAHAASASDHNPNKNGVVCALDLTHDPANGFDAHALAERVRVNRHPNLRYVISNARIAGWWTNWEWQPSSGHTQHAHFSVGTLGVGDGQTYDRYDDTTNWNIKEENKMKVDINNARQMAYSFLGRDGRDGRKNAIKGETDEDLKKWLPNELTNNFVTGTWDSKEAQAYRVILDKVYAERDSLRAKVKELEKQISSEYVKVSDLYIKKG
jgi:hypothetical protein